MATAETQFALRSSRILIASSSEEFRRQWAVNSPYDATHIEEAAGGADALAKLETEDWSEVLLDRRLHDLDVSEVIATIRSRHPHLLVRLVDSDLRLEEPQDCLASVNEAAVAAPDPLTDGTLGRENTPLYEVQELTEEREAEILPSRVEALPGMMGVGPGLAQVFRLARLVAPRQTSVLITGETGTGKELVARGIHQISSRSKSPFVVVNCAAIPEQLLEAELFGHARGAFTGAVQSRLGRIHVAHGGTLFLDEVGELPLSMQVKLLRFLQDGEVQRLGSPDIFRVDVRVISATNVNLLCRVQERQFRQDLYYRLAVFPLELPPLRQRREDIIPLAEHFLDALSEQSCIPSKKLSSAAGVLLQRHSWPGNVRELQHAVERAFILAGDEWQLCVSYFNLPEMIAPLREI
jgi:DNA-binding NtrC family response regulator